MKRPAADSNTPAKPAASATAGKKRVTFAWPAAGAPAAVAGDFSGWEHLPLAAKGQSQQRTVYLPPGTYEYLFVVAGEWCADPACAEAVPNPFGGRNSLLRVA